MSSTVTSSSSPPFCQFGNVPNTKLPKWTIEATTHIGLRPAQEDRVVVCPRLAGDYTSFCGVFDGTVGFEASEYIQQNIVKYLGTNDLPFLHSTDGTSAATDNELGEHKSKVGVLLRNAYLKSDAALIKMCTERGGLDYASSTGVSVLLWPQNMMSVAHVGDSRACLGRVVKRPSAGAGGGENTFLETLHCEWLTVDHKPDQPAELKRIQDAGGSLVYLHGNKPFIRGGDFLQRQALGQHPKQLNYSRAFGGKDLKMYGLSADPSISHRKLVPHEDRFVIIASDGLWDTLPLKNICEIAWEAYNEYKSDNSSSSSSSSCNSSNNNSANSNNNQPTSSSSATATTVSSYVSDEIIKAALHHMPLTTVRDNISCIVVLFEWDAAPAASSPAATADGAGIAAPPSFTDPATATATSTAGGTGPAPMP